MIKVIVTTEEEKRQLLEASMQLHDNPQTDTSQPMIKTLAHLYLVPQLIVVDPALTYHLDRVGVY